MKSAKQTPTLLDIVGNLYEAASDMSRWGAFLKASGDYFGAQYVNMIHLDGEHSELSFSLLTGFEAHSLEAQQEGARKQIELQNEDPRMIYSAQHPNKPVRCVDIMPIEQFRTTRVYRELLQPAGIEYSLMVQYTDTPGNFTGISFHRSPEHPPFSDDDCANLGALLPHLRQALTIQQRINLLDHQLQAAQSTLNAIQPAIILVNDWAEVEFANLSARELLSARSPDIAIIDGKLSLGRHQAKLLEALRQVNESGEHAVLNIARLTAETPLQCLITRLHQDAVATAPNLIARPRLAIYLSDPDQPIETSEQLLQRLFGLTAAEGRVLGRLVAGLSVDAISTELGSSINTVRTQLKSLFAKTDTSRQGDLIQRVLSSPIWIARMSSCAHTSNE